jgi:hypothetical protein
MVVEAEFRLIRAKPTITSQVAQSNLPYLARFSLRYGILPDRHRGDGTKKDTRETPGNCVALLSLFHGMVLSFELPLFLSADRDIGLKCSSRGGLQFISGQFAS